MTALVDDFVAGLLALETPRTEFYDRKKAENQYPDTNLVFDVVWVIGVAKELANMAALEAIAAGKLASTLIDCGVVNRFQILNEF